MVIFPASLVPICTDPAVEFVIDLPKVYAFTAVIVLESPNAPAVSSDGDHAALLMSTLFFDQNAEG
jgi:hypothetical protein